MMIFNSNTNQPQAPKVPLMGDLGGLLPLADLGGADCFISVSSLSKSYDKGSVLAVKNVSFSVNKGEIFGLIGPDGAGKTSIFRILTTLLLPDSGTAQVLGYDVVKDFRQIRNEV